jgi:hypothetical protein
MGEEWPLVVDEPVEFEKHPVEVQGFGNMTNHLKRESMECISN